jgi:hypothetical protein
LLETAGATCGMQYSLKGDFGTNFKTLQSWDFCKIWNSYDYKIYNWLVFLLNAHYLKTKFKKIV